LTSNISSQASAAKTAAGKIRLPAFCCTPASFPLLLLLLLLHLHLPLLLLQLPVYLLHGCSIHMPAEPPAAHSKGATPPAAKQPAADALQHGKAHAPAQVIGHVALDGSDAASEWWRAAACCYVESIWHVALGM
jgi:hypothetical protein